MVSAEVLFEEEDYEEPDFLELGGSALPMPKEARAALHALAALERDLAGRRQRMRGSSEFRCSSRY